jgi:hypothetical protein
MREDAVVICMNNNLRIKSLSFIGINDRLPFEGYCNLDHGTV